MNRFFWSGAIVLGLASTVLAHEGHGTPGEGDSARHYLLEPLHLPLVVFLIAVAVAASAVAWRYGKHRRQIHESI